MRITIDTETNTLTVGDRRSIDLYGKEAFELISELWLKTGWNQKYSYTFTWMGRPLIQHPEDVLRMQEAVYTVKPDVIIETGVAHGGSIIFSASLLKAMGKAGRVVGVDIEIRPHNRKAIEAHELMDRITLIEGDSTAPDVVAQVEKLISRRDKVMVILDSDHSYGHVTRELEAYHRLVSIGSYIVATDGIMQWLSDVPRGKPQWRDDNPARAAADFARKHPEFVIEEPAWLFNESQLTKSITAWPNAWLKRVAALGAER